jgi:hypothetical protein
VKKFVREKEMRTPFSKAVEKIWFSERVKNWSRLAPSLLNPGNAVPPVVVEEKPEVGVFCVLWSVV